jgi:hypothetical protein
MPAETIQSPSTTPTGTTHMTVADQLRTRFDDLQDGLTAALGIVEDLVRGRISSLVTRDDDS